MAKKRKGLDLKNKNVQKILVLSVVVIVAIVICAIIFQPEGIKDYTVYIKGNEMMHTGLTEIEPWQVTEDFIDSEDVGGEELKSVGSYLGNYTRISADGKRLFYFDEIGDDGATLYYRQLNKSKKGPVKIDSHVTKYILNEKSNRVTYIKSGDLYQSNLKKSTLIAEDVRDFEVSEDGKNFVWIQDDGTAYFQVSGRKKEQIDSDIKRWVEVSEDCKSVWYMKGNILYTKKAGRDRTKVASEVNSVLQVYESGSAYFLKEKTTELTVGDYVDDDMKEKDASVERPDYLPLPSEFQTKEEYEEAYKKFEEKREAWLEKEDRDVIREVFDRVILEDTNYELVYYNGKKEKTVATDVQEGVKAASDAAVTVYSAYDKDDVIKISEIESIYDMDDMTEEVLEKALKTYVAVGNKVSQIETEEAYDFEMNADGKTIYYIDHISDETMCGDVYKVNVSGNKVKQPEKYDTNVYKYGAGFIGTGQYAYYKSVDTEKDTGELFVNKVKLDANVELYSPIYNETINAVLYMVDWEMDKEQGTLKQFQDGKKVSVAKEVHTYSVASDGTILYLSKYDMEKHRGKLYLYNGDSSIKIDDGVVAILTVF